jgi:uncharacterized membrane protein YfcA
MMGFLSQYAGYDLFWIGLSLFLLVMSKGGFPVGSIALPVLILVWPSQTQSARETVGFMLPMLCIMDCIALAFYWRHIHASRPSWASGTVFGFFAGVTSTLAHAAGSVMQMYFLPQQMEKKKFAGSSCAFFWMMNGMKLVPFVWMGRIHSGNLKLGSAFLPVIPLGVVLGWRLTHKTQQKHYMALIYIVLFITSVSLIVKAV